jgi:tRNA(Arg) A34 adenosine deaminase TadA
VDGVTSAATVWRTDEPCPVCMAGLFLIGRGEPVQVAECRLCGWSETWDLASDASNENGGDAR